MSRNTLPSLSLSFRHISPPKSIKFGFGSKYHMSFVLQFVIKFTFRDSIFRSFTLRPQPICPCNRTVLFALPIVVLKTVK